MDFELYIKIFIEVLNIKSTFICKQFQCFEDYRDLEVENEKLFNVLCSAKIQRKCTDKTEKSDEEIALKTQTLKCINSLLEYAEEQVEPFASHKLGLCQMKSQIRKIMFCCQNTSKTVYLNIFKCVKKKFSKQRLSIQYFIQ